MLHMYYDGQLPEEDVALFLAHLKRCLTCQKELKEINRVSDFVKVSQDKIPEAAAFDAVWERVEKKLVRERLSILDVMNDVREGMVYYLGRLLKPAVAVCFILFLILLPIFEHREESTIFAQESEIKKIESRQCALIIFRTKNKQWNVIWVVPIVKEEEENHV